MLWILAAGVFFAGVFLLILWCCLAVAKMADGG